MSFGRLLPPPNPNPLAAMHPSALQISGMPDNSAVLAREVLRARGRNGRSAAGALGEYIQDLPHRVLQTTGGAGQSGGRGPMSSPVIPGPRTDTVLSVLQDLRALLERLPETLSLEWRTKFIMTPREAISFIAPSNSVLVPAGTAVAVVSQTTQERYTGFLTHVGVGVQPVGSFSDVIWQIRVNGAVHPEFSNRVFFAPTLSTPLPFPFELTQSRTIQLVAINTSAVDLECQGLLVGWTEYMGNFKMYGASPSTGIA